MQLKVVVSRDLAQWLYLLQAQKKKNKVVQLISLG